MHSIEVVVFPGVFYPHVNLLVPDAALVVQGRVNFTDDGVKVLADTITALDDYRQDYYISLAEERDEEATVEALYGILAAHPGEHIVFLNRKGRWQKLEPQYWLDASPAVVQEIEALLGKNSVLQR